MRKGFTLIELLVVIAIISLLSSIVLASLNTARGKARDAQRVSDLKQLQLALELCYDTQDSYFVSAFGEQSRTDTCYREPLTDPDFVAGWGSGSCVAFLKTLPKDPGSTIREYAIHTTPDYKHYVLLAALETRTPNTPAQISAFINQMGITDWTSCPEYNYVLGN